MGATPDGLHVDLPETVLPAGLLDVAVAGAARYDVSAHTSWFRQMLTWALAAAVDHGYVVVEDDPSPTTGGPQDYGLATGCRCHYREDAEWGEVLTPPSDGQCPIHRVTGPFEWVIDMTVDVAELPPALRPTPEQVAVLTGRTPAGAPDDR